jgi:hypothetical protein
MNLVSVVSARAIWLFDLFRLNPKGLSNKVMISGVTQRYAFSKAPSSMLDVEDNALVFDQGEFITEDGNRIYVGIKAYSDGLVGITSSSTRYTTEFMTDLSLYLVSIGFSFPPPELIKKGFASVLLVESDIELVRINPALERVLEFVHTRLVSLDDKPRTYQVSGIGAWTDDAKKPFAPMAFRFERKMGVPFKENLYYSEAPLQTDEHLELLDMLEQMLR